MGPKELEAFRELLRKKLEGILKSNKNTNNDIKALSVDDISEEDEMSHRSMQDVLCVLSNRNKDKGRSIKNALEKIDEGTFGICEGCEKEIPINRLNIFPDAKLCVRCAEMGEKNDSHYVRRTSR